MSTAPAKNEEKKLRQEVFSYFVETLLSCCLHLCDDFLIYVHFEV
jgi:hypothetical protein